MTTVKCIVIHVRTVCIYISISKISTFSKRSGTATKGFKSCEFLFHVAFFYLNIALYFLGWYACMEENNLKILLALYILL